MSMEVITIVSLGLTVITVGIMLAGLILTGQRALRAEMNGQRGDIKSLREEMRSEFKAVREELHAYREETQREFKSVREEIGGLREEIGGLREEIGGLRERMAHVEGLLEGLLREAFIGRRAAPAEAVAEDPGPYDKR